MVVRITSNIFWVILTLIVLLVINRFYFQSLGSITSQSLSLSLSSLLKYRISDLTSVIPVHQFIVIDKNEVSSLI